MAGLPYPYWYWITCKNCGLYQQWWINLWCQHCPECNRSFDGPDKTR